MPEDTRRDTGRPSIFSQELADAIFAQIGEGRGLSDICRDEGMPNRTTIYRWLAEDEAFRRQYAVACEMRAEHRACRKRDPASVYPALSIRPP